MKKKILFVLLSVMMLALIPLTGCGGSDNTADIKASIDGFMGAIQAGDLEGMKEYADPALYEGDGDFASLNQLQNLSAEFANSLGVDEGSLSDSTKTKLSEFVSTLLSGLVKSYEIGDITESDGKATANVKMTLGFDPDKIDDIDVNDEIEDMATKYMDEHMDELMEVYNDGGQDAIIAKVVDDLMGDILDKFTEEIMNTGEVTEDTVITLENKDGKWLVTGDSDADDAETDDAD